MESQAWTSKAVRWTTDDGSIDIPKVTITVTDKVAIFTIVDTDGLTVPAGIKSLGKE